MFLSWFLQGSICYEQSQWYQHSVKCRHFFTKLSVSINCLCYDKSMAGQQGDMERNRRDLSISCSWTWPKMSYVSSGLYSVRLLQKLLVIYIYFTSTEFSSVFEVSWQTQLASVNFQIYVGSFLVYIQYDPVVILEIRLWKHIEKF